MKNRTTITDEEFDLLRNLRKSCEYALRLGLGLPTDRLRLKTLAERAIEMVDKIGAEK